MWKALLNLPVTDGLSRPLSGISVRNELTRKALAIS